MAVRLVIEIDGSQHAESPVVEKDNERTRWLESEGYRVLRFWNNEITRDIDAVLAAIHSAISPTMVFDGPLRHERDKRCGSGVASHPTPARFERRPSPSRGG
jgi:Protein of unknown function (DUF559)